MSTRRRIKDYQVLKLTFINKFEFEKEIKIYTDIEEYKNENTWLTVGMRIKFSGRLSHNTRLI